MVDEPALTMPLHRAMFARQDAWSGFVQVEDTEGVLLVLVNNLTERKYRARWR